ncbi:hypothetical protein I3760_04G081900 [Carya illinoinensis]|nr:hypothetical protein I3760_04G081900 [Carya illinoinensis]
MGDDMISINQLPPGFRFCPTDEELVLHFLFQKASLLLIPCHPSIIPDLDLCLQYDPWDFNGKTFSSVGIFYFFSRVTENRVTKNGYWKDLDVDEIVLTSGGKKVGIKRYFVFCVGHAPAGFETSWRMQEYHLYNYGDCGKWVLCRVHEREQGNFGDHNYMSDNEDNRTELSSPDEICLAIMDDDLDERSFA